MNKLITLFLFVALSASASASDLVYCPQVVECLNTDCTFEQDDNLYWSAISNLCDPDRLQDGSYHPSYVSAPYRAEDVGYAICVYTHAVSKQTLMLRARLSAKLLIFEDTHTHWRREESWGECRPTPLENCPLQVTGL
jgi:hypothetical protein